MHAVSSKVIYFNKEDNNIIVFFIQLRRDQIFFENSIHVHNVSGNLKSWLPFKISKLKFVIFKSDDFIKVVNKMRANSNILVISIWYNKTWVFVSESVTLFVNNRINFTFFNLYYTSIFKKFSFIFFLLFI